VLAVQHGKSVAIICLVPGRFVFPSSSLRKGCAKLGKGCANVGKGARQGYSNAAVIVPGHRLQWFPDY
jgi:hypothetical protein